MISRLVKKAFHAAEFFSAKAEIIEARPECTCKHFVVKMNKLDLRLQANRAAANQHANESSEFHEAALSTFIVCNDAMNPVLTGSLTEV
jgi:hypothetical protein